MAKNKQKEQEYDGSIPLTRVMQEEFVCNLFRGMNQTQAYRKAGYKTKTPERQAVQIVCNSKVKARIAYKRAELAKKHDVTAERIVGELAKIGFSNIKDYIGEDNAMQDISSFPDSVAAAVESIQTDIRHDNGDSKGFTEKVKFKLHSKIAALDKLANHLGLYQDIEPNVTFNILVQKA